MLAWSRIGANPQVIEFIDQGIKLPIDECTPFHLTNYRKNNTKQTQFLREEIKRLLTLNYIKVCDKKPRFISPIWCVPKKGKNKFVPNAAKKGKNKVGSNMAKRAPINLGRI